MRRNAGAWITAAVVLPLAACGDGGGEPASPGGSGTAGASRSPTNGTTDGGTADGGATDGDGTATRSPSCAMVKDWTTGPDVREGNSRDAVTDVRAGRHECFDRVVVDLGGTSPTGFDVEYVSEVREPGRGKPVPVAGAAPLRVTVHAPARGTPGGGVDQEPLADSGEHLVPQNRLSNWGALRSVRYAGAFEGVTTLAVGVRQKLPFRAFSTVDEDDDQREVIVDIAHHAG